MRMWKMRANGTFDMTAAGLMWGVLRHWGAYYLEED